MWKSGSQNGAGSFRHALGETDGEQRASVPRRIARYAAAHPDAIALRRGAERMSYGELAQRIEALAAHLRTLGIGREAVVGIAGDRSFGRIIALLAVWRAEGACLPLDPLWPEHRLRHLLEHAQAIAVIGPAATVAILANGPLRGVAIDEHGAARGSAGAMLPSADAPLPDDLAYVIYTSGTSNEPKGVEITHGNLENLLDWHLTAFDMSDADIASHVAGLGFDAAIWEVTTALCAGATLTLASDKTRTSPLQLRQWLLQEKVTIGFVPTAIAELMMALEWPAATRLRYMLTGGETLHSFPRPDLPFTVVNNYGPAECTIVAASAAIPPHPTGHGLPSIGKPIANTTIHLLDAQGLPVAPGWPGEICISGAGVGRGYRQRPDLTAERFQPDPNSPRPNARLYRTGDIGCFLPNGEIAFRSRIDDQVTIRGYRVEHDAVVAALTRHPDIASCAVLPRDTPQGEKLLVAYVVPGAATSPSGETLRAFLAASLPEYMIPSAFVGLKALPLTADGKLDRAALPKPTPGNALGSAKFRGPTTPVEAQLAAIVARVLGCKEVSVDDNFFLIGGDSLLGTQVVMGARETFAVALTLWHLFEAQTVASLAATIERLRKNKPIGTKTEAMHRSRI